MCLIIIFLIVFFIKIKLFFNIKYNNNIIYMGSKSRLKEKKSHILTTDKELNVEITEKNIKINEQMDNQMNVIFTKYSNIKNRLNKLWNKV